MMNKPAFYQKMLKSFHDRFIDAPATIRAHPRPAASKTHDAKRIPRRACRRRSAPIICAIRHCYWRKRSPPGNDVEAEIVAFGIALDVVLAGLRAQFGWTAAQ